jgi:hypothetical protein
MAHLEESFQLRFIFSGRDVKRSFRPGAHRSTSAGDLSKHNDKRGRLLRAYGSLGSPTGVMAPGGVRDSLGVGGGLSSWDLAQLDPRFIFSGRDVKRSFRPGAHRSTSAGDLTE